MAQEPDDNTLDNAGPVGRDLADSLSEKIIQAVDGFPGQTLQKTAIARLIANNLYDWTQEQGD